MFEGLKERFGFTENTENAELDIERRHHQQMKLMKYIVAALLVVIGIIGASYSSIASKMSVTVDLPPYMLKDPKIKVGNGWSNDMYMRVWAEWMVDKTATFTPGDVREKLNELVRIFSQDRAADYAGQLGGLSNLVIRNQIKQEFSITDRKETFYSDTEFQEEADGEEEIRSAIFVFAGEATQSFGAARQPDKKCSYTVSLKFEGAHLYGYSYNTTCFK